MKNQEANVAHCSRQRLIKKFISLGALACSLLAWNCYGQTSRSENWFPFREAKARFEANSNTNSRIIGGQDAALSANPWQVALLYADDINNARAQFCGGSVIADKWVLTAAHCLDAGVSEDQVVVLAGTRSLATGGTRFKVEKIFLHEKWNRKKFEFDIALLRVIVPQGSKLGISVTLHENLKVDGGNSVDLPVRVTGWGVTESRPTGTDSLQGVELPLVTRIACNRTLSYGPRVTVNMICAGATGTDACQGDSGGPATIQSGAGRELLGITSWGEGCGRPNKFGVYTRVARFVEWTKLKMSSN